MIKIKLINIFVYLLLFLYLLGVITTISSSPADKKWIFSAQENELKTKLSDQKIKSVWTDSSALPPLCSASLSDPSLLCGDNSPFDGKQSYPAPILGNGLAGWLIGTKAFYMSGLFNDNSGGSRRAPIPSPMIITVPNAVDICSCLGTTSGLFTVYSNYTSGSDYILLTRNYYFHRVYEPALVFEVDAVNYGNNTSQFNLVRDLSLSTSAFELSTQYFKNYTIYNGSTSTREGNFTTEFSISMLIEPLNNTIITVPAYSTISYRSLSIVASSVEVKSSSGNSSIPPTMDEIVQASIDRYNELIIYNYSDFTLWHTTRWSELDLWSIESSNQTIYLDLNRKIQSSWYIILSSASFVTPTCSLSPGTLATDMYAGHLFWDSDLWIMPNLMLFHPDYADYCYAYRNDASRIQRAREKAILNGYSGVQLPWESAATGVDVTIDSYKILNIEEIHINGDVMIAHRLRNFLRYDYIAIPQSYELIKGLAEFWVSRAVVSSNKTGIPVYSILNVTGPDEYHSNVDDNPYTNQLASQTILYALQCASILKDKTITPDIITHWTEVADNLVILFDPVRQIHLQYGGYTNQTGKQADIALLGYPGSLNMNSSVQYNDLIWYSSRIDAGGPCMTRSIETINYLSINQSLLAYESFLQSSDTIIQPYYVWSETSPDNGNHHFETGAGGWLQSLWAGYAGLRFEWGYFYLQTELPPGVDQITMKALYYSNYIITFTWDKNTTLLTIEGKNDYNKRNQERKMSSNMIHKIEYEDMLPIEVCGLKVNCNDRIQLISDSSSGMPNQAYCSASQKIQVSENACSHDSKIQIQ